MAAVGAAWRRESRHPFTLVLALRGAFKHMGLHVFRAGKGPGFVAATCPRAIDPDHAVDNIREVLPAYRKEGIRHMVALRGDIPSGVVEAGEFRHANELVRFIREETGDHFHIEVAAYPEYHPQATSPDRDLANFKRKVEAGADSAITQYFYNADAYFRFVERCRQAGIDIPIVPGIMPITNYYQLARFSDTCGAEIPRWIRKRLEAWGEDLKSIRAFGEDVVTALCTRLLEGGAPGLHFYTLNKAEPSIAIWRNLGLSGG